MKYVLILFLISGSAIGKGISFDAFKVDTSISDIKPEKKEIVPPKIDPVDISFSSEPKVYRPGSYVPTAKRYSLPTKNDGMTPIERMNQSARGANPNL